MNSDADNGRTEDNGNADDNAANDDRTGNDDRADPAGAEARRAEQRFIDDLISRGEAVPEGEELPAGATHVVAFDDQGRRTVRRVRFKAY